MKTTLTATEVIARLTAAGTFTVYKDGTHITDHETMELPLESEYDVSTLDMDDLVEWVARVFESTQEYAAEWLGEQIGGAS